MKPSTIINQRTDQLSCFLLYISQAQPRNCYYTSVKRSQEIGAESNYLASAPYKHTWIEILVENELVFVILSVHREPVDLIFF
jgi:hypothetical protein